MVPLTDFPSRSIFPLIYSLGESVMWNLNYHRRAVVKHTTIWSIIQGGCLIYKSHYNIRDIIFNIMYASDSVKNITSRTIWIKLCFGILSSGVWWVFDDNGEKSVDFGVNCPKSLVKKKTFLKWLGIWLISTASANKETEPQEGPKLFHSV